MADVAGFDMQELTLDELNYGEYDSGGPSGKSYGPPPAGKYYAQNGLITDESFGQTKQDPPKRNVFPGPKTESGAQAVLKVKVQGQEDAELRVFPFSTKKYSNRMGSQAIDWLRACGIDAQPKSDAEFKALAKMASGKTFQFGLDWEGFVAKDDPNNIKGMTNFPKLEDGTYQPWVQHPYDDEKRIWARPVLKYFVDAVKK